MHLVPRLILSLALLPLAAAAPALETQKVADGVYALVGELGQRSPANLGNNATFGVIVTGSGVVLVDPGGSYLGAQRIHAAIRRLTAKPVVWVINTGGQDQRWLGNGYFQARGARILAARAAVADQKARANDQLTLLENLIGAEGLRGTREVYADTLFDREHRLTLGGAEIVVRRAGPAHTPGDSYVWLPQKKVVFTGDIVYVERLLGVGAVSDSKHWIGAFEEIARLGPRHVVPGHGHATDLARARRDTYDYLVALRRKVRAFYDAGRGLEEIGSVRLPSHAGLENYAQLNGRNAHRVYQELEWE